MSTRRPFGYITLVPMAVFYAPTRKGVDRWAIDTESGHRVHVWNGAIAQYMSDRRGTTVYAQGYTREMDDGTVWVTIDAVAFNQPIIDAGQTWSGTAAAELHAQRPVEPAPCRIPDCTGKVAPKAQRYTQARGEAIADIRVNEQLCHGHALKLYAAERALPERAAS